MLNKPLPLWLSHQHKSTERLTWLKAMWTQYGFCLICIFDEGLWFGSCCETIMTPGPLRFPVSVVMWSCSSAIVMFEPCLLTVMRIHHKPEFKNVFSAKSDHLQTVQCCCKNLSTKWNMLETGCEPGSSNYCAVWGCNTLGTLGGRGELSPPAWKELINSCHSSLTIRSTQLTVSHDCRSV